MPRYRNASGVIVTLPDDDTAARLLATGWTAESAGEIFPSEALIEASEPEAEPEAEAEAPMKRKPGRPRKSEQD